MFTSLKCSYYYCNNFPGSLALVPPIVYILFIVGKFCWFYGYPIILFHLKILWKSCFRRIVFFETLCKRSNLHSFYPSFYFSISWDGHSPVHVSRKGLLHLFFTLARSQVYQLLFRVLNLFFIDMIL